MRTKRSHRKVIIGIHGLANKPAADVLEKWWRQSIEEGLRRLGMQTAAFRFELVFWADILHPERFDHTLTDPKAPLFLAEPYTVGRDDPAPEVDTIKARVFSYIDRQLDALFLREDMTLNLKGVTDRIVHRYFSDLEKYYQTDLASLADPQISTKEHIQQRLLDVLRHYEGYDILLIAHSMGSIIAYDVLSDHASDLKIRSFLTMGSPLGIPYIMVRAMEKQLQQYPGINRPLVPNCITERWVNLSDKEDRVALDHALNDDFRPNIHGVAIEDFTVYNDYLIQGERNPHKSFGYLRTTMASSVIEDFLRAEPRSKWLEAAITFIGSLKLRFKNMISRKQEG